MYIFLCCRDFSPYTPSTGKICLRQTLSGGRTWNSWRRHPNGVRPRRKLPSKIAAKLGCFNIVRDQQWTAKKEHLQQFPVGTISSRTRSNTAASMAETEHDEESEDENMEMGIRSTAHRLVHRGQGTLSALPTWTPIPPETLWTRTPSRTHIVTRDRKTPLVPTHPDLPVPYPILILLKS